MTTLTSSSHRDLHLPKVVQDQDGVWHYQLSRHGRDIRYGAFETQDEAQAATRDYAVRQVTTPISRDEYEAIAEALGVTSLTDEEIDEHSYAIRYQEPRPTEYLLALRRLEAMEEVRREQQAARPTPPARRPTTGPGGCPRCGGPTSVAGEPCGEC